MAATFAADEIPFELAGRIILINGEINGRGPYKFILDTGATHTVITPPTAEAVGLTVYPAGNDQKVAVKTSISVGNASASGMTVYVFDPLQAVSLRLNNGINYHGIIGADFLSQFLTTIDYRQNRMVLEPMPAVMAATEPKAPSGASDQAVRIPFVVHENMILAKGTINGKGPVTFLIDTGAAETLVTPSAAKSLRLGGQPSATQPGVWFTTLERLTLGAIDLKQFPAVIHLPAQENGRLARYHGILGYSFLSRFRVTIDYRAKSLWLDPEKTGNR